MFHGIS
jgi:hypothetical protein